MSVEITESLDLARQIGDIFTAPVFFDTPGTAALPSISIDGDPNTGVFFPAADVWAISTAGSERIRVFGGAGATTGAVQWEDGVTAAVSALTTGAIRYNDTTTTFQVSLDGAVYVDIATGGAPGPWDETAGVVHLDTSTNNVTIGSAANIAKLGVVGDTDEVQFRIVGDAGQTADILQIEDSAASRFMTILDTGELLVGRSTLFSAFDDFEVDATQNALSAFAFINTDSGASANLLMRLVMDDRTLNFRVFGTSSAGNPGECHLEGVTGEIFKMVATSSAHLDFAPSSSTRLRIVGRPTSNRGMLLHNTLTESAFFYSVAQLQSATATIPAFRVDAGVVSNSTASTELFDVRWNLARSVQFATGALALQRAFVIEPPTYSFVAASTITTAATVAITGAPVAGTNATITNAFALDVTGATRITGKLTVTGSIDPTDITLSGGGTGHFIQYAAGEGAAVSAAGTMRIRYDAVEDEFQVSLNGSSYQELLHEFTGHKQGGNSFGVNAVVGTNDAFALAFETSGTQRMELNATQSLLNMASTVAAEFSQVRATSDTGTRVAQIGIANSSASSGAIAALDAFVRGVSTRLLVGTFGAFPTVFVTNDVERFRILGTANTIQGNAGFEILAGTTDAHVLTLRGRAGSGTTYVLSQIGGHTWNSQSGQAANIDSGSNWTFTQGVLASGSPTFLSYTSGAHTTLAAGVEAITANLDFSATVQFSTGAIVTQRTMLIQGQTIAFVAGSTVTTATTLEVESPVLGAFATFTNVFAARFTGNVEVTGKLTVGGLIDPTGTVYTEQATVPGGAPAAGQGTVWVRNDTPNVLMFTNDAGTDAVLATSATAFLQGGNSFGALTTLGTNDAFALAFETNGVERARILSTGFFGIGTDTPNARLDVTGTPGASVGGFPSGMLHVTNPNTAVNAGSVITGHNLNAGNKQLWYLGSTSSSDDNIAFINRQNASLALYTNSLSRLTIEATGNMIMNGDFDFTPGTTNQGELGTDALKWNRVRATTVVTGDLELKNGEKDWTIREGLDEIFAINNRTGKKYRMMLEEVA